MKIRLLLWAATPLVAALCTSIASAQTSFQAVLVGGNEVPANNSTASGFGTVVLSADQSTIIVNESWTGLTTPATASHIHGPALPGVNANVLFPFSGVPSATSGSIPQQSFSITPTQVGYLLNGQLYMNVHDATFGGGEIRGQLLPVPEPSTFGLIAIGIGSALGLARFRKR
jgi:hypothetical protein